MFTRDKNNIHHEKYFDAQEAIKQNITLFKDKRFTKKRLIIKCINMYLKIENKTPV